MPSIRTIPRPQFERDTNAVLDSMTENEIVVITDDVVPVWRIIACVDTVMEPPR